MDITDFCGAIDDLENYKKENFFKKALQADIKKLNEYAKQQVDQNNIVVFYCNAVFVCSANFYNYDFNTKNKTYDLITKWNNEGFNDCKIQIDKFANIYYKNKDKYMSFGYGIKNYFNSTEFLKLSFDIKFYSICDGYALFKIWCVDNSFYCDVKFYVPLYQEFEEFEEFDQVKFLQPVKDKIYKQIATIIISNYKKTGRLSLNDKYRLIHITKEINDFKFAKELNKHRSKLPKHLKDILDSIIIAEKLIL